MGAIQTAFPAVAQSGGTVAGNLAVNGTLSGDVVELIGNNAIAGANAGLDAAFAGIMRVYNNYASGNTQYVTPNGAAEFYAGGNNVLNVTNLGVSLVPNISVTAGGAQCLNIGAAAALGIYFGSGVPTVSAPQGSLYLRTDGSSGTTRAYINTTGSTTWTAISTVG
jgi:hypothetical protein